MYKSNEAAVTVVAVTSAGYKNIAGNAIV